MSLTVRSCIRRGVRVLDTDGPYLVVAADKGTAAFSDIANELAESRGFWLGDAFASGGKHGYDHKKMGITARGAWESAKRHLREMGREIDRGAPVTMVGIGDMSGDVFGNGLLHSDNLKLIAAFDHRHIFIDPDPDPKLSFAERKRLYQMPASQLGRLRQGAHQQGRRHFPPRPKAHRADAGGPRGARMRRGRTRRRQPGAGDPARAGVDLLYNGGIGTYVRASSETDAEVGDHANDNVPRRLPTSCAAKSSSRAAISASPSAPASNMRWAAAASTPTPSTIPPASICPTTRSISRFCSPRWSRAAHSTGVERNRQLAAAAEEVAASVLRDNRDQVLSLSLEQIRSRVQPERLPRPSDCDRAGRHRAPSGSAAANPRGAARPPRALRRTHASRTRGAHRLHQDRSHRAPRTVAAGRRSLSGRSRFCVPTFRLRSPAHSPARFRITVCAASSSRRASSTRWST